MNLIAAALWLALYPLACAVWAYVELKVIGRTMAHYEASLFCWWVIWFGVGAALYFGRTR